MDARDLIKILEMACEYGNMFDGPHTKRPMIDVGLGKDGLFLSSWWEDMYYFKIISWEAVILSHGDAIKSAIDEMRSVQTNGEGKNV